MSNGIKLIFLEEMWTLTGRKKKTPQSVCVSPGKHLYPHLSLLYSDLLFSPRCLFCLGDGSGGRVAAGQLVHTLFFKSGDKYWCEGGGKGGRAVLSPAAAAPGLHGGDCAVSQPEENTKSPFSKQKTGWWDISGIVFSEQNWIFRSSSHSPSLKSFHTRTARTFLLYLSIK